MRIGWLGLILAGVIAAADAEENVFWGYYFAGAARGMTPDDIAFEQFTHIGHAFLLLEPDGAVRTTRSVPDRRLVELAHEAGARVILSLGGWGTDEEFAAMTRKSEQIDRYVREVVEIVEEYGYDGVDLDWEYPDTEEEVIGFAELTRKLRQSLDDLSERTGNRYELTKAVSASPHSARWLDSELLLENMDYLNVMTYDFSGPWSDVASNHSPLFSTSLDPRDNPPSIEAAMAYWEYEKGFPRDRLNVGIPFYGRGFDTDQPYRSVERSEARYSTRGYRDIVSLLDEGWQREWDEEARIPFAIAPDGSAVIGYDDPESVAEKTRWAREQGYRGIFFWAVGHDWLGAEGGFPLQAAAYEAWPIMSSEK